MNEEHDNLSDEQTINGIIINLKLAVDQLSKDFTKAKDLIHELARRLDESKQCERDQVSRKIKKILKDKISEGKITAKWIEDCLSPEYTRKYTPKSEVSSLSKENRKGIEVDASGNSIVSAATSDANPNNLVVNEDHSPDVEIPNTDTSLNDKDLEEEIKRSISFASADQQLSEQATVVELKTENERLRSDLQSKSDENSSLHIRIKELETHPQNDQADRYFDVQFQLPFEDVRVHMSSALSKNNAVSQVSFSAKVDVVNRRLTDIQIG
jgi:DNA anti-recombination protein RmuC